MKQSKTNKTSNLQKQLEKLEIQELEELKKRTAKIVNLSEGQLNRERIRWFVPTEIQEEFLRDKSYIRLFQAGNKVGKSTAGIIESISQAIGYRSYLKESDPDYKTEYKPPVKIRIYGEDFAEHVNGVVVPTLKKWIPHSEFRYSGGNPKKNPLGIPVYWVFNNGSSIELLTYEQESSKSEGWDGHFIHFDEPPPRSTYIAAKRGLIAEGGKCIFTLTPIKQPWIYDQIWQKQDEDILSIKGFQADITSNLKHKRDWWRGDEDGKASCGYLSQRFIDQYVSNLTDEEKEARIHGRFMHLSGLVYKEFNPSIHRIPWFDVKSHPVSIYEAIDVATRKPWAVTFMTVRPDGIKYIIDEIYFKGVVSEIAEAMKQKRKQYGYAQPLMPTIIDPLAVAEDPINKTSVINEFMKEGIYCQAGSKDRNRGIQLLKEHLKVDENEKPGIYVMENCRQTLYEFGHYIWDEWQKKKSMEVKDAPKKENDDMLENIHRLLIAGIGYREPPQQREKKRIIGIGNE